jgi:hypothetical protein
MKTKTTKATTSLLVYKLEYQPLILSSFILMLFIEQKEVASLSSAPPPESYSTSRRLALSNRLGLCMPRSTLALVLIPLEEIRVWPTRDTRDTQTHIHIYIRTHTYLEFTFII